MCRLGRTRSRKLSAVVSELERTVEAVERALASAMCGQVEGVISELSIVAPWLRREAWHAANEAALSMVG